MRVPGGSAALWLVLSFAGLGCSRVLGLENGILDTAGASGSGQGGRSGAAGRTSSAGRAEASTQDAGSGSALPPNPKNWGGSSVQQSGGSGSAGILVPQEQGGTAGEAGTDGGNAGSEPAAGRSQGGGEAGSAGQGSTDDAGTAGAAGSLPCESGDISCVGRNQLQRSICNDGLWTAATPCQENQRCDAEPGPNQGLCRAIIPECADAAPGDYVCADARLIHCGPDLVTAVVEDCSSSELCDSERGRCNDCSADSSICPTAISYATCDSSGQWLEQNCPVDSPFCVGSGECVACVSDGDCSGEAPECYRRACVSHVCTDVPAAAGVQCASDGGTVCNGQGSCGVCQPDERDCGGEGGRPRVCLPSGQWDDLAPCNASSATEPPYLVTTPICEEGLCVPPPSCRDLDPPPKCADQGCCDTATVPGGNFPMGDADSGNASEKPVRDTYVSQFNLDVFEVTVGRFRTFMASYDGPPAPGQGRDPRVANDEGWSADWDGYLPATAAEIEARFSDCNVYSTWTPSPGDRETYPITCVDWFTAYAFCAYDGGWLPSEAEWEYAAAGGAEDRTYPWGDQVPDSSRAVYEQVSAVDYQMFFRVGSKPAGAARFGQLDMAGNVAEWVLDWYDPAYYSLGCMDCANVTDSSDLNYRSVRGGNSWFWYLDLRVARRDADNPESWGLGSGIRCARP